jgi:hypothetical protein
MVSNSIESQNSNMKINAFHLVLIIISVSCTKVIYTHKQVMDGIKTKEQAITKFGLPNSKMNEGEFEQWYYDYGTVSRSKSSSTYTIPESSSIVKLNFGNYFGSTVTTTNNKYVKLIFKGEDVIKWETQAVNFQQKGTDKLGNALLLGPAGLLIKSKKKN